MSQEPTVRLEELLGSGEEEPPAPRHRRSDGRLPRDAIVMCVYAAGFALVAFALLRLGNLGVAYPLLFVIALGVLVIRRAVREVGEPEDLLTGELVRRLPPVARSRGEGWYEGSDGLSRAVMRWETRLEWTSSERKRFAARVPGLVGELTDERLRQRHGITRASHPERARELCGPTLWAFVEKPVTKPPSPRELAVVVTELENI
jgi:hypothetical protein